MLTIKIVQNVVSYNFPKCWQLYFPLMLSIIILWDVVNNNFRNADNYIFRNTDTYKFPKGVSYNVKMLTIIFFECR